MTESGAARASSGRSLARSTRWPPDSRPTRRHGAGPPRRRQPRAADAAGRDPGQRRGDPRRRLPRRRGPPRPDPRGDPRARAPDRGPADAGPRRGRRAGRSIASRPTSASCSADVVDGIPAARRGAGRRASASRRPTTCRSSTSIPIRIREVVSNLVDNALRYMPGGRPDRDRRSAAAVPRAAADPHNRDRRRRQRARDRAGAAARRCSSASRSAPNRAAPGSGCRSPAAIVERPRRHDHRRVRAAARGTTMRVSLPLGDCTAPVGFPAAWWYSRSR